MNTCTIQLTEQTALVLQGYRFVLAAQYTRTLKILKTRINISPIKRMLIHFQRKVLS